jgi:hypothetical protein
MIDLMACSVLLSFPGTPSWSRNVKSLPLFFSNRFLQTAATSVWKPRLELADNTPYPHNRARFQNRDTPVSIGPVQHDSDWCDLRALCTTSTELLCGFCQQATEECQGEIAALNAAHFHHRKSHDLRLDLPFEVDAVCWRRCSTNFSHAAYAPRTLICRHVNSVKYWASLSFTSRAAPANRDVSHEASVAPAPTWVKACAYSCASTTQVRSCTLTPRSRATKPSTPQYISIFGSAPIVVVYPENVLVDAKDELRQSKLFQLQEKHFGIPPRDFEHLIFVRKEGLCFGQATQVSHYLGPDYFPVVPQPKQITSERGKNSRQPMLNISKTMKNLQLPPAQLNAMSRGKRLSSFMAERYRPKLIWIQQQSEAVRTLCRQLAEAVFKIGAGSRANRKLFRARSLLLVHHGIREILLRRMSPKPVSGLAT